jgi:hypothetical protein
MYPDKLDNCPFKYKRSLNVKVIVRGLFDDHNSKKYKKINKIGNQTY